MQPLEVISVNLWQILISLANLVILFLILKKFLFAPVRKTLAQRQSAIDAQYQKAAEAQNQAEQNRHTWEQTLLSADTQADAILKNAADKAKIRGDKIIAEAKDKAADIDRQAKEQAIRTQKQAENEIRQQIIEVSTALTEKMLSREITPQDHSDMIDSFIDGLDGGDDGDQ